jgi:chromosome segregation ATPase
MSTEEAIRQQQKKSRVQAYQTYIDLVKAIARNENVNPEKAEGILNEVGKTTDQLLQHVSKERKRIEIKELLEKKPEAEAELQKTINRKEALLREYEKVGRPILNQIEVTNSQIQQLQAKAEGFIHIEGQLEANYWNEMVLEELAENSNRLRELARNRQNLQLEVQRFQKLLDTASPEFQYLQQQLNETDSKTQPIRENFNILLARTRGTE